MACGRESHPLASYGKFQGVIREERWDIVMKGAQCKNCSNPGYIASKCHAPPMRKRCHQYHHMLLQKEADTKPQTTKEPSSTTYVAPSRPNEEVLLMTCRVKVMAPDGSITQARALLDCAA